MSALAGIARINIGKGGADMVAGLMQPMIQDQPICHFMKAENFFCFLDSSRLWLRRSDLFDDQEEGLFAPSSLTDPLRSAFSGFVLESSEKELREQQHLDRMTCFIHCWFGSDPETEAMWHDYGDQGRGVCLQSSTAKFASAVRPQAHMSYGLHAVTYSDANNAAMELCSSLSYCRKRTRYAREKEIRFLASMEHEHSYLNRGALPNNEWPDHVMVDVDLQELMTAIILGSSMDRNTACRMRDRISNRVPKAEVTTSRIVSPATRSVPPPRTKNVLKEDA